MDKKSLEQVILRVKELSGIPAYILEKDYYVCEVLKNLSIKQETLKAYFKGGTAVYKILSIMKRFSEDIDLTVKVEKEESNTSNVKRLKLSALNYDITGLELIKDECIDKKGSVTAFYKYDSLFDFSPLFKAGKIQIESTSFTVSEPTSKYTIEPLIYKYASDNIKQILKEKYNISEFDIEIIKLERIFVDKIFAIEFYYTRKMYSDVSKHLYDITNLFDHEDIKKLLSDEIEFKKLVSYKRKEENYRIGGISEDLKISDFTYFHESLSDELEKSYNNMQSAYVLNDEYLIDIEKIKNTIKKLYEIIISFGE